MLDETQLGLSCVHMLHTVRAHICKFPIDDPACNGRLEGVCRLFLAMAHRNAQHPRFAYRRLFCRQLLPLVVSMNKDLESVLAAATEENVLRDPWKYVAGVVAAAQTVHHMNDRVSRLCEQLQTYQRVKDVLGCESAALDVADTLLAIVVQIVLIDLSVRVN
jgi:hypothetical protein